LRGPTPHKNAKLAIVMEFCRLGTLWNMIKKARELQKMMSIPGFQVPPRVSRTDCYRFYRSWERRLEVNLSSMNNTGQIMK